MENFVPRFDSNIEELNKQIEKVNLETLIHIKLDTYKQEVNLNLNISDIFSTSQNPPRFPSQSFNRHVSGYVETLMVMQDKHGFTPIDKLRTKSINPFGIYLDIDCIQNIEEAIDK